MLLPRLCQCHPKKLSSLYTNYPEFKMEFNPCVYDLLTPTKFQGGWEQLVEKYDLEDHAWLNDIYATKTQSIRAYNKQFLCRRHDYYLKE